jgi:hypothetical protein
MKEKIIETMRSRCLEKIHLEYLIDLGDEYDGEEVLPMTCNTIALEGKVRFEILAEEYFKVGEAMRKSAINWLRVKLRRFKEMDFGMLDKQFTCSYDGGANPECANNCFSVVEGVYLKGDDVFINLEDCDNYEIDKLSNDEVYNLCDYVKNEYLPSVESKLKRTMQKRFAIDDCLKKFKLS